MFIKQVFFGVLRYKNLLKIFTDEIFSFKPSSKNKKDEALYFIIVFITIFRIDEIPLEDYQSLVLVSFILFLLFII